MPVAPPLAATPGPFLCFVAMVLLVFVSISAPVWNNVSFLDVVANGRAIHFGVFGYTGSSRGVGYSFDPAQLGLSDTSLNDAIIRNLTFVLVLHPVAAAVSTLAVALGLCGTHARLAACASLAAAFAALIALVAWAVDMILWGVARNRIRDAGARAQYGNANWLTLAALIALVLGFCTGTLGACGRCRRRRGEKV